jgi:hypothetical protein
MIETYVSRYGSPETRRLVRHEEDECAACKFIGGVTEGGVVFVIVERSKGEPMIRRIEGLASIADMCMNGCEEVTREEADREIAFAYFEGRGR